MDTLSLLPIGAFSNATQLSAKALRLYAEHGILAPARVDTETGYRYYRPEQVRDARLVRLLRDLDMPLAQIAELIGTPAATEAAAKRQMDALARRYIQQQTAYHALLALLYSTPRPVAPAIALRNLSATNAMAVGFEANSRNLLTRAGAILARLQVEIGTQAIALDAAFIPLSTALSDQDDADLELYVPVPAPELLAAGANLPVLHAWPAQAAACTEIGVQDGIPDLSAASDALFDWFDRHGHSLHDTPRLHLHPHTPQLVWPLSRKETP